MLENLLSVNVKNKAQPLHYHDRLELFFVICGEMDLFCNDRSDHLIAGDIGLVNRDDVHSVNSVTEDLIYIQMTMDILKLDCYLPGISKVYFKGIIDNTDIVAENLRDEIRNYIAQIIRVMTNPDQYQSSETTLIYYCIEILSNLKMRFNHIGKNLIEGSDSSKFDQIWEVVDYVYDNCWRKLTIKEVAEHIFASPSYLRMLLREYVGKTFEEFLSYIRAETSLKYLISSNRSITNIAYECGFSAPRYYYAAFQKIYHCSPAEYRNRNKELFVTEKLGGVTKSLLYDSGVTKSRCFEAIERYRTFDRSDLISYRDIKIDLQDAIIPNQANLHDDPLFLCRKDTVILTEDDFYRLRIVEELTKLKERLGFSYIKIDSRNKKLKSMMQKRMYALGLKLADEEKSISGDGIQLRELFDEYGEKRPVYRLLEVFHNVTEPFKVIDNHCILYAQGEASVQIIVYNLAAEESIDYVMELSGMKPDKTYLCCIREYPVLSDKMTELLNDMSKRKRLNDEELKGIFAPKDRYMAYDAGSPCIINGRLTGTDITSITVREL